MFRWIKDFWVGSEPVEFISAYGLTESVTRLKAATKRGSLFNVPARVRSLVSATR